MTREEAVAKVREFREWLGGGDSLWLHDAKGVVCGLGVLNTGKLDAALEVLCDDARGLPRVATKAAPTCAACKGALRPDETASWCVHCNGEQCERCCLSKRSKRAGR